MILLSNTAACLVPPDVLELPVPENQRPFIDPEALSPVPSNGPVNMVRNCPSGYQHQAVLKDADREDTLYWRVFLDYSFNEGQDPIEGQVSAQSTGLIVFNVFPDGFVDDDVPHAVELLVTDRPFFGPTGRVLSNDALFDEIAWRVSLTPGTCL